MADTRLNVRMDPGFERRLKVAAAEQGKTLSELVTEVLGSWLDRYETRKAK
jgi:predicted HicB family RNase H-like nuclease